MNVIFYKTEKGKVPIADWLQTLDSQNRIRILARLKRLEHGNLGDSKSVGYSVYELRMFFGPGYRIYFAKKGLETIVLLCGGDKVTQEQDIEKAKRFLTDFNIREKDINNG